MQLQQRSQQGVRLRAHSGCSGLSPTPRAPTIASASSFRRGRPPTPAGGARPPCCAAPGGTPAQSAACHSCTDSKLPGFALREPMVYSRADSELCLGVSLRYTAVHTAAPGPPPPPPAPRACFRASYLATCCSGTAAAGSQASDLPAPGTRVSLQLPAGALHGDCSCRAWQL